MRLTAVEAREALTAGEVADPEGRPPRSERRALIGELTIRTGECGSEIVGDGHERMEGCLVPDRPRDHDRPDHDQAHGTECEPAANGRVRCTYGERHQQQNRQDRGLGPSECREAEDETEHCERAQVRGGPDPAGEEQRERDEEHEDRLTHQCGLGQKHHR